MFHICLNGVGKSHYIVDRDCDSIFLRWEFRNDILSILPAHNVTSAGKRK